MPSAIRSQPKNQNPPQANVARKRPGPVNGETEPPITECVVVHADHENGSRQFVVELGAAVAAQLDRHLQENPKSLDSIHERLAAAVFSYLAGKSCEAKHVPDVCPPSMPLRVTFARGEA